MSGYTTPVSSLTITAPTPGDCSSQKSLNWVSKNPGDVAKRWFDCTALCALFDATVSEFIYGIVYTDGQLNVNESDTDGNIFQLIFSGGTSGNFYSIKVTANLSDGQILTWYISLQSNYVVMQTNIPAMMTDPIALAAFIDGLPTVPTVPFWNNAGILTRAFDSGANPPAMSATEIELAAFIDSLPNNPTAPFYVTGGQLMRVGDAITNNPVISAADLATFIDGLPTVPTSPFWNNNGQLTRG